VPWLLVASLSSPVLGAAETGADIAQQEWSLGPMKSDGGGLRSRLFGQVSDSNPPWVVEAPGATGARFGLGLDLFFERQESLRITFMEQSIRARDLLSGTEESGMVRTDPGLLNRKFDLRLDLAGAGVQPAVALPLPRALGLYSTLIFQAAEADVSLDFRDRNRPEDSSSLKGRGPLFGAGLDLTRSLCRSCPWFAGASYFFQRLPSRVVDRSPSFGPQGFEILEDDVQLSRDIQEASTRIGYGFSGNRVVSYLGVRHRWTDVEIKDHLRYHDPFGVVETTLDSRTRLASEVTLALAGVEARLGPRLFGRMETSVGDKDWGALFRVVYLWPEGSRQRVPDDAEARGLSDAEVRGLELIAAGIAQRIAQIQARFLAGWKNLTVVAGPDGQAAYLVQEVETLLWRTEKDILAVLHEYPELEALEDWIGNEFRRARRVGGLAASLPRVETIVAGLGLPHLPGRGNDFRLAQAGGAIDRKSTGDKGLGSARDTQEKLRTAIQIGLQAQLTFETSRKGETSLEIFPRRNPKKKKVFPASQTKPIPIGVGSYSWTLYSGDNKLFDCDGNEASRPGVCPIDIIVDPCVKITCGSSCKVESCR
jgi:hypothetical protein